MKFTIIRRKNIRSSCWRQRSKEAPGFEVVQIRGIFVGGSGFLQNQVDCPLSAPEGVPAALRGQKYSK